MSALTAGRVLLVGLLVGLVAVGVGLLRFDIISTITYLSYAIVGSYLVARRPRNAVGWLLIANGWLHISTTSVLTPADATAIDAGTASFGTDLRAWAGPALGSLSFVVYAALAFVFPSGSLPPGPAGRRILGLLVAATAICLLPAFLVSKQPFQVDVETEILIRNPFAIAPLLDPFGDTLLPLIVTLVPIATLAVAVVHTARRYRHGDEILRLQLRWLAASIAFVAAAVVFGLAVFVAFRDVIGGAGWIPALLAYPLVPVAVGAAVLRYRLFEIDRIVSRTIAWVVVTALLGGVFALGIVALSTVFHEVTSGDTLAVAASTLLAAVLFQPLRERVQHLVDRRFDRARVDGEQLAEAFSDRLRSEVDLMRLLDGLTATAEEGVRPSAAGVWIRPTQARS